MSDPVKAPEHYCHGGIQPLDFIEANNLGFHEGNIVKYITRWKHKDGIKDLKKAQEYLRRLIGVAEKGFLVKE